ncbi:MAG: Holliday junction branch migration DNA helicase RuvB [Spirochaetales bacterium]|nr:Holliday junction branch migration DNA helicase RuvB [Spirochaetales bacterium]
MSDIVVDSNFNTNTDLSEVRLRPSSLDQFQGQSEIKKNLKVFIQAALNRNESLDHLFISGPPGLGKTTLAGIIASEMNAEFKVTSAPALDKPKDLAGILTSLTENTVFFIDEIHRLKPALEEMLYIAMEDYELDWIIGQGPSARSIRVPVAPFTLVGATTKAGSVSAPLFSRFGIDLRIDLYSVEELSAVVRRSASIENLEISDEGIVKIASCSRGTPRIANRILRRMRDFAEIESDGYIGIEIINSSLARLGIDDLGLTKLDRRILTTVINNYGGGPVGAETLAINIGESVETLEDFYEPFLIRMGFIQRTPRGRVVTENAYKHLGLRKKSNENERLLF